MTTQEEDEPDVAGWRFWGPLRYNPDCPAFLHVEQSVYVVATGKRRAGCDASLASDPRPHAAPGPDCRCGIRVVEDLGELIGYVRCGMYPSPHPALWSQFRVEAHRSGEDYYNQCASWGTLDTPDVIGRAAGSGRRMPANTDDPPTTWRCEYLGTGDRLYLSPSLSSKAATLARKYRAEVVVGSVLGFDWLDEIETYEADHPWPVSPSGLGSVTYLAPPGTVLPSWVAAGHDGPPQDDLLARMFTQMVLPGGGL